MLTTQNFESSNYQVANKLPLHKDKPRLLINQRSRSVLSLAELPPSPAESDMETPLPTESPLSKKELRIIRPLNRGTPGDQAISSDSKSSQQKELAKQKSQFYRDAFAQREPITSARERVSRESMIIADVKTNVIIQDEYTFITDLSYFLSTRYQRPESFIIVTLTHSVCLLFGGSFDPAYTIEISALESHLQPVTNKRNTVLLGRHIMDTLGPRPERGLIKFIPIAEENMGTNSKTVAGQIDDMEKEATEHTASFRRSLSRSSKNRHSTKSLHNMKAANSLSAHAEQTATPTNETDTPSLPPLPAEKSAIDVKGEKVQKVSKRKSFIANIFGKGG